MRKGWLNSKYFIVEVGLTLILLNIMNNTRGLEFHYGRGQQPLLQMGRNKRNSVGRFKI